MRCGVLLHCPLFGALREAAGQQLLQPVDESVELLAATNKTGVEADTQQDRDQQLDQG
jgi:hypothetical protein